MLDDARFNGDTVADVGQTSCDEPELSWRGPLAVGATATITYSVTVNDSLTGNATLENAVTGPPESSCPVAMSSRASTGALRLAAIPPGCGVDVPVQEMEVSKTSKPSGDVEPGAEVEYPVTVKTSERWPTPRGLRPPAAPSSTARRCCGVGRFRLAGP
ncbi:MAG TPA: hypothetical protein VIT65_00600 [Microlunatus sp.]